MSKIGPFGFLLWNVCLYICTYFPVDFVLYFLLIYRYPSWVLYSNPLLYLWQISSPGLSYLLTLWYPWLYESFTYLCGQIYGSFFHSLCFLFQDYFCVCVWGGFAVLLSLGYISIMMYSRIPVLNLAQIILSGMTLNCDTIRFHLFHLLFIFWVLFSFWKLFFIIIKNICISKDEL